MDDGYSGANFQRPDWQRMMALVDEGKIGVVIAKDMSRIGRNYLEVGMYTEITFPQNNVRFIAVNSGVDSSNQSDNEFAPFLNIINEFYVKDGSKKVRASLKLKGESGEHLTTIPPYGYVKTQKTPSSGLSMMKPHKLSNASLLYAWMAMVRHKSPVYSKRNKC